MTHNKLSKVDPIKPCISRLPAAQRWDSWWARRSCPLDQTHLLKLVLSWTAKRWYWRELLRWVCIVLRAFAGGNLRANEIIATRCRRKPCGIQSVNTKAPNALPATYRTKSHTWSRAHGSSRTLECRASISINHNEAFSMTMRYPTNLFLPLPMISLLVLYNCIG